MSPGLVDFLLARIDEDEVTARAAKPGPWSYHQDDSGDSIDTSDDCVVYPGGYDGMFGALISPPDGAHIARHDPARVLAECDAKRRMVAVHSLMYGEADEDGKTECNHCGHSWPCWSLAFIALPYADHPDYREEWKP